jgi:hypothetical protein
MRLYTLTLVDYESGSFDGSFLFQTPYMLDLDNIDHEGIAGALGVTVYDFHTITITDNGPISTVPVLEF